MTSHALRKKGVKECADCIRLRFAWYATATPCDSQNSQIIARVIEADRKRTDYIEALKEYREHRKTHYETAQAMPAL